MSLSIGLAARGRPDRLIETVAVTLGNMQRSSDTQMVVALDDDDRACIDILRPLANSEWRDQLIVSVAPREDTVGAKWNRVLKVAPASAYLMMGDYVPMITPGFDQRYLDAVALHEDGIGVVYNHLANLSFPCHQVVTHKLAMMMGGQIYPELFPYWFVDHWVDDIAKIIGRIAFADCEVRMPSDKPATQEMREPAFWSTFYDALAIKRLEIAHRIIRSPEFKETEARKRLLLNHHPLIEERSVMVNNRVRAMLGNRNLDNSDPRYARLKQQAIKMLQDIVAGASEAKAA